MRNESGAAGEAMPTRDARCFRFASGLICAPRARSAQSEAVAFPFLFFLGSMVASADGRRTELSCLI